MPLSVEVVNQYRYQYRCLFRDVKSLICDEISMVGAELLAQVDPRLKQILYNYNTPFGGLDIFFIGDLRQLPPVRATPIYKPLRNNLTGASLWRSLQFYEITKVMRQENAAFSTLLTKIGNGEMLNDDELQLIESRFFTQEQTRQMCPNAVRLFFGNNSVNAYSNEILNEDSDKVICITNDIINNCTSAEQQAFLTQKLHKMSSIDTGGLPYQITFSIGKPYLITTNIDVTDGLANGAVGNLNHIEFEVESNINIKRLWLIFPDKQKIGRKIRLKKQRYMAQNNIHHLAVPIDRRTCSIPLNRNKTIHAKRQQFPLIPACAMTIHKSQGGTFEEIIYNYNKKHTQELLYVALPRVTSIEGLFIVSNNNDKTFHHGRRAAETVQSKSLHQEFQRLSLNTMLTITDEIISKINESSFVIFSHNCQSLHKHKEDVEKDFVAQKASLPLLSETLMNDNTTIEVNNFQIISQQKRLHRRNAGVALYKNYSTQYAVTLHTVTLFKNAIQTTAIANDCGDICAAKCQLDKDTSVFVIAVYSITPNTPITDIITFLYQYLMVYTDEGAALLSVYDKQFQHHNKLPMILSGDFNVNFNSDASTPLVQFLHDKLHLRMTNESHISTTIKNTTNDATFSQFLESIHSHIYISYFSYHKPIVTLINSDTNEQHSNAHISQ